MSGTNPSCLSFNHNIDSVTSSAIMATLADMTNKGHDEIHFLFSTYGGTVADGIAAYNFIRALPAKVIIYNIGTVNSIGNVIYQAGDERICAPSTSFMFHGVGFDITNARLELKELTERMKGIQNDQAQISEIMVRHTNLGNDDVDKLFLEMAFLNANEAFERGITDEVRQINLPKGVPIVQLVFQR